MEELRVRLEFALPADEKNRITLENGTDGITDVTLDVHGMPCSKVQRLIRNMLNLARQRFRLTVIHGYNHGTAIKSMLPTIRNQHIVEMHEDTWNQGRTHILVA